MLSSPFADSGFHTCAQEYEGPFYCWGRNIKGQLGDGTTANKNRPTVVKLGDGEIAVQVVAGYYHTCVINDSGAFYCWVINNKVELDDDTTVEKLIPTLLS